MIDLTWNSEMLNSGRAPEDGLSRVKHFKWFPTVTACQTSVKLSALQWFSSPLGVGRVKILLIRVQKYSTETAELKRSERSVI